MTDRFGVARCEASYVDRTVGFAMVQPDIITTFEHMFKGLATTPQTHQHNDRVIPQVSTLKR
jgi:hypothetical protein